MECPCALAEEIGDREPREWRRLSSQRSFFVREGTTGPQEIPPGSYRYAVSGRNVTELIGDFMLMAGTPLNLIVTVTVPEKTGAEGAQNPGEGGQPGEGAGRRQGGGGGPGAGGRQGGGGGNRGGGNRGGGNRGGRGRDGGR